MQQVLSFFQKVWKINNYTTGWTGTYDTEAKDARYLKNLCFIFYFFPVVLFLSYWKGVGKFYDDIFHVFNLLKSVKTLKGKIF